MAKIQLRNIRVSDAKDIYNILNNPEFKYFTAGPDSIEAQKELIRGSIKSRKQGLHYQYIITYRGRLVGCCSICRLPSPAKNHICSIGYFLDEKYWGRGFATEAVKMLEKICFEELGLVRVEIIVVVQNIASRRVAEKCGYKREARIKKWLNCRGTIFDCYMYSKVI